MSIVLDRRKQHESNPIEKNPWWILKKTRRMNKENNFNYFAQMRMLLLWMQVFGMCSGCMDDAKFCSFPISTNHHLLSLFFFFFFFHFVVIKSQDITGMKARLFHLLIPNCTGQSRKGKKYSHTKKKSMSKFVMLLCATSVGIPLQAIRQMILK